MSLIESYLQTTKNLNPIIDTVVNAQAPDKFTIAFLEQLGFKSTNDRLYLKLFKDLGLLDGNGVPTSKYYEFIDQSRTKKILAECIQEAYSDLFQLNKNAQNMTKTEVKNKMKTIFQGKKTDNILDLMAKTFKELCSIADFSNTGLSKVLQEEEYQTEEEPEYKNSKNLGEIISKQITTEMHYNIQIHLPETKDISVFDAIFKSLKDHLL
ncbi:DUF5343 domain-containing protein [Aequorivita echinoideorum]|uniref:DUF5343 domain-containing protein n=1 Tax=Aequorivita echinoideorum TaxID=1549647 RepID=A0ABS5S456_9FLAO|nr:DUF5343 domain-containing protein [Aequorivita echinoideorum]MBT0607978.1 DUF5343 domain-containing protein [Aequorivita echinoideorum]